MWHCRHEVPLGFVPEDDLVLATAVAGKADYLVTGDKGLLAVDSFRGIAIVTPRRFLDLLNVARGESDGPAIPHRPFPPLTELPAVAQRTRVRSSIK